MEIYLDQLMKLKPLYFIVFFGFVFLNSSTTFGQESSSNPLENIESVKAQQYTEGHDNVKNVTSSSYRSTSSDTTYLNLQVAQEEEAREAQSSEAKENEEDVLSFNFLYYIIQKFKMSDIVDK